MFGKRIGGARGRGGDGPVAMRGERLQLRPLSVTSNSSVALPPPSSRISNSSASTTAATYPDETDDNDLDPTGSTSPMGPEATNASVAVASQPTPLNVPPSQMAESLAVYQNQTAVAAAAAARLAAHMSPTATTPPIGPMDRILILAQQQELLRRQQQQQQLHHQQQLLQNQLLGLSGTQHNSLLRQTHQQLNAQAAAAASQSALLGQKPAPGPSMTPPAYEAVALEDERMEDRPPLRTCPSKARGTNDHLQNQGPVGEKIEHSAIPTTTATNEAASIIDDNQDDENSSIHAQTLDYAFGLSLKKHVFEPVLRDFEYLDEDVLIEALRFLRTISRGQLFFLKDADDVLFPTYLMRVTNRDTTVLGQWKSDLALTYMNAETINWWMAKTQSCDQGCEMFKLMDRTKSASDPKAILGLIYFQRSVLDPHGDSHNRADWEASSSNGEGDEGPSSSRSLLIRGIRVNPALNPESRRRNQLAPLPIKEDTQKQEYGYEAIASTLFCLVLFTSIQYGANTVLVNSPKHEPTEAFYEKFMGSPKSFEAHTGRRQYRMDSSRRWLILAETFKKQLEHLMLFKTQSPEPILATEDENDEKQQIMRVLREENDTPRLSERTGNPKGTAEHRRSGNRDGNAQDRLMSRQGDGFDREGDRSSEANPPHGGVVGTELGMMLRMSRGIPKRKLEGAKQTRSGEDSGDSYDTASTDTEASNQDGGVYYKNTKRIKAENGDSQKPDSIKSTGVNRDVG